MAASHLLPARYYARFCQVLEQSGVQTRGILARAGIARRDLQAADHRLTLTQVEALVEEAARLTGRSDLSLEVARALKLTSHSTVSYGILSSPTAGYALRLVARFFSLILPSFRMHYAADDRRIRLTVTPVWPQSPRGLAFHLELIAAAVHWELGDLVGTNLPRYDIYFSLSEPPHVAAYARLREVRAHFGWQMRPGLRMEWPARVATWPLALSDPGALRSAEQRCAEMVRTARDRGEIAGWVHMMIREAGDGAPSMRELANTLNLSTRTLDRYLKGEGTSFRALSKQASHAKACTLLGEQRLSVTQTAFELGYTDVSNFARAFRRTTGLSPGEWQRQSAPEVR